jgi:hypothetical protein
MYQWRRKKLPLLVYTTHGTLPPVAPSLFLEIHGLATDCGCPLLRSNRLRRGKKEESRFFHGHGNQPLSFLFFSFLQSPEEIEGPVATWVYDDYSLARSSV